MNLNALTPQLLIAILSVASPCWADANKNLVTNGDFEAGKTSAFWGTTGWYNQGKGLNQGAAARSDKGAIAGQFSAGVVDRHDPASGAYIGVAHTQITEHRIQPGDVYTLSFDWRPLDEYWQRNRDTVRFVVFATSDDTLKGQVVWSEVVTSDFFRQPLGTVKTVVQELPAVTEAAHGKRLMLTFHGVDTVDGVTGSAHFARVDNIVLMANPSSGGRQNGISR